MMSLMKFKNRKGFTLIEVMIVIVVIAILAAVLIPKSGLVQKVAKESGVEANARVVQGVIENMLPRYGATSQDANDLRANLASKLDGEIVNPFTAGVEISGTDGTGNVTEATAGDVLVISTNDAKADGGDAYKGVVWVQVTDKIAKIVITPYDQDGKPITKAVQTIR